MSEKKYIQDSFDDYLGATDRISASDIKTFLQSPALYWHQKNSPKKQSDGRHYQIGSAVHAMILEPQYFNDEFVVVPNFDMRKAVDQAKAEKFYSQKFIEKNGHKISITEQELELISEMANNAMKNETLVELIKGSYREVSIYTVDEKTGLKVRLRPDSFPKTKNTILDLKTAVDSSPKEFIRSVYNYGYDVTAAFYMDFAQRENYVFACIEKQAPYQTELYMLDDAKIEAGRKKYRMGLDLMKFCKENNFYPSHVEFQIMKESYELENLDSYFDTLEKSEKILIL